MYQVYYDNTLIYDPRGANCAEPGDMTYALIEGRLSLAVNTAGQLTMTLAAGHPILSEIRVRLGVVKVVELIGSTATTVFLGRVISDSLNFDGSHTYTCEGRLACLNDTAAPWYPFPLGKEAALEPYETAVRNRTVPAYRLAQLLSEHNTMAVSADSQIQPGTVTVRGGNMLREGDSWTTTWQRLLDDLPNSALGGFLVMRYVGDTAYLDYLASFADENPQAVTFARNLIDITHSIHGEDYFNAVLPLGKDRLTCRAEPNGYYGTHYKSGTVVSTPDARDAGYGNVVRVVKWDDVENAATLITRAVSYLDAAVAAIDEITVSAADLSGLDPSESPFRIGKLLRIDDPPQGVRTTVAVIGLDIDITGDVDARITLGSKGVSLTGSGGAVNAVTLAGGSDVYVKASGDTMTGPLEIVSEDYAGTALLRVTDDGRGNLQLSRADGTLAVNIYALASGSAEIDLLNAAGATRAALFISSTDRGSLRLYDADGNSASLNYDNLTALLALLTNT